MEKVCLSETSVLPTNTHGVKNPEQQRRQMLVWKKREVLSVPMRVIKHVVLLQQILILGDVNITKFVKAPS
jgi:hypothetical protein